MFIGTWFGFNIFYPDTGKFKRIYQKFQPQNHYYFSIEYFGGKLITSGVPPSYLNAQDVLSILDVPLGHVNRIKQGAKNRCWFTGSNVITIVDDDMQILHKIPVERFYGNRESVVGQIYPSKEETIPGFWVVIAASF